MRATPLVMAASLLFAWAGDATADDERKRSVRAKARDAATATTAADASAAVQVLRGRARSVFSVTGNAQHDGTAQHLPPTQHNIQLVGEREVNTPANLRIDGTEDEPVLPGQIADLAVYKDHAYLNSWAEETCERGGTFVMDISNPASPQQVGFLPALPERYHGEGAHVVTLDTPAFKGDLLAVNNESCNPPQDDALGLGGFDLYDVTDPSNPRTFVQGVGD